MPLEGVLDEGTVLVVGDIPYEGVVLEDIFAHYCLFERAWSKAHVENFDHYGSSDLFLGCSVIPQLFHK